MSNTYQVKSLNSQTDDIYRRLARLENLSSKIYGNITIDGNTGTFLIRDDANTPRVQIDGNDGFMKISEAGVDVRTATNDELLFNSEFRQIRESTIHTGGGNTFTNVAPFVDIPDFLTKINFNDWIDQEWYFEASFKAGTGTARVRLRNVTDASTVAGSEVSTTSTAYVSVRSGSITKPTGTKTFVVQYGHTPSGGGGDFINLTICRHIFRRPV